MSTLKKLFYLLRYSCRSSRHSPLTLAGIPVDYILYKLRRDGFFVIDNFLSSQTALSLQQHIKGVHSKDSRHVVVDGDSRIYGVESLSSKIEEVTHDEALLHISNDIYQARSYLPFVTSGVLSASPETPSSGGGWHRDSLLPQFKSMIYCSDVAPGNGEFQILPHSHSLVAKLLFPLLNLISPSDDRYTQTMVDRLVRFFPFYSPCSITASSGSLVIFDSSSIHRGTPIFSGERVSLTSYYFPVSTTLEQLSLHFPLATTNMP